MKLFLIFVVISFVFILGLFLFQKKKIPFSSVITDVIQIDNQFALELYREYQNQEGNIFFSPYSISVALAMAYEGAKGKTAKEIQNVFHFPEEENIRRSAFAKIFNQINKKDKEYQLHTANALWAQKEYPFLSNYFELIGKYYGGKVQNLDFKQNPQGSGRIINQWVEDQTNQKIKNLIPEEGLSEVVRLILTNAIYFKGEWLFKFTKSKTQEREFKITPSQVVQVPMMTRKKEKVYYAETEELQILEMLYLGKELSMLILLPKGHTLEALEHSLSLKKLTQWKELLRPSEVIVYLPKFKFEKTYFLTQTLQHMGMPTAFSQAADFSAMTGRKDLFISDVIHKAFVEVNEEGTEAAAATAVMMMEKLEMPDMPIVFNCDHPFLFIIQESASGNILFLGRVTDPRL